MTSRDASRAPRQMVDAFIHSFETSKKNCCSSSVSYMYKLNGIKRRVASLAYCSRPKSSTIPTPVGTSGFLAYLDPPHMVEKGQIRMCARLDVFRPSASSIAPASQSSLRFKRRAHAIPFIVKDASIDAPRQHRAACARHHRASPRQSSRPPRAIGAGRVSPPPRIAPRRRPRLVAVVPDSSRIVRRTCTDESRARASSPSRSSLGSSPSAATESWRGGRGGGGLIDGS